jgi:alkanesulfonate monooxygenase SsuD/methylene tetrahydromethanopterin reductase-like flavin-dependent oxidoreductase (luciferase family)
MADAALVTQGGGVAGMEFGLMVEPQMGGTYKDLLAIARAAEKAGYASIARSDHYLADEKSLPATDALTTMAGLARETESIKLTVLVTPLTFRHPGVIAKTATTLDEMSGGRFELGVGTGWMESEHRVFGIKLPELRTRFSLLFETLAYVHSVVGRTSGGYSGRHFNLEDIDILPRPAAKLPIIVGGLGMKRTPAIAGRFADEYNTFACDAETLAGRVGVMTATAAEVGRDAGAVKVSITTQALIGDDESEYRDVLGAAAAEQEKDAGELETTYRDRRMLHGTFDQAAEQVAQYAAEGVGRIYIQHYSPLQELDTGVFGRELRALGG